MADPANTTLGKMLMEEITPVVMVLSTPLVEEACQKNALSFVHMLSPFSGFNNIDGTSSPRYGLCLYSCVASDGLNAIGLAFCVLLWWNVVSTGCFPISLEIAMRISICA